MEKQNEISPVADESVKTETKQAFELFPKLQLRNPWLTLASVLIAAIGLMLLWWKSEGAGLRWPLSVLIVGVTMASNALIQKHKIHTSSGVLFLIALATSLIPSFRSEGVTVAISVLATVILLILFVVDFFNGQWWQYRIREYFKTFFVSMPAFFVGLPVLLHQGVQYSKAGSVTDKNKKVALGILKGVLIALPVLIVFISLFSSADLIFKNKLGSLMDWLKDDSLKELSSRFWLTFFFTILASAGLWLAFTIGTQKAKIEPDKALWKPFLGLTETSTVLISVNLLFAFFLAIQFKYFFAGEANISAAGYTYAEYARKGFVELLFVASLAGLLYYSLAASTRRESPKQRNTFAILGGLLLAQVMVVLVSAHQRILLYTYRHGQTEIRLVPKIFIYFLAAILVSLVVMEWKKQFKRLALVLLTALTLFSLTLAVVNIDRSIARTNVERALAGEKLDYNLLVTRLSDDAVPYLYEVLDSRQLSKELQVNLSKVLVCRAHRFDSDSGQDQGLNWNYSWSQASAGHLAHQDLLEQFPLENLDVEITKGLLEGESLIFYNYGFVIDDLHLFCRKGR